MIQKSGSTSAGRGASFYECRECKKFKVKCIRPSGGETGSIEVHFVHGSPICDCAASSQNEQAAQVSRCAKACYWPCT